VTKTSNHEQDTFLCVYPLHRALSPIKNNRTLLFDSTPLKHSRHFDY
jgi:hypothetical protein